MQYIKREGLSSSLNEITQKDSQYTSNFLNIFGSSGSGKSSLVANYMEQLKNDNPDAMVMSVDVAQEHLRYPENALLALRNSVDKKFADSFALFDILYLARSEHINGKIHVPAADFFKNRSNIISKIANKSGSGENFLRNLYLSVEKGSIAEWYEEKARKLMIEVAEQESYKSWELLVFAFGKGIFDASEKGFSPYVVIDNAEKLYVIKETGSSWFKQLMDISMSGTYMLLSEERLSVMEFGEAGDYLEAEGLTEREASALLQISGVSRDAVKDKIFDTVKGNPAFLNYNILTNQLIKKSEKRDPGPEEFQSDKTSMVHFLLSCMGSAESTMAKMLSVVRHFDAGLFNTFKDEFLESDEIKKLSLKDFTDLCFVEKVGNGVFRIHPSFADESIEVIDSDLLENINYVAYQYHTELIDNYKDYRNQPGSVLEGLYHAKSALDVDGFLMWFHAVEKKHFTPEFFNFWLGCYEEVLSHITGILGETHPETGVLYDKVAYLYLRSGRISDAENALKKRLMAVEEKYGKNTAETVSDMNKLASVYSFTGDYKAAEAMMQKGLDIREKFHGEKHIETAESYFKLGRIRHLKGEKEEALGLVEKAYRIYNKELQDDDENKLEIDQSLAVIYSESGELAKSVQVYKKIFTTKSEKYGQLNKQTLISLNDYAAIVFKNGQNSRAIQLYEDLMEKTKRVYGNESRPTAAAANDLAVAYQKVEEYEKAERMHNEAIDIKDKIYGKHHPSTATSYTNYGQLKFLLGDLKTAEPYYVRALKIYETVYGEEHEKTALGLNNMGFITSRMGHFERAELYYRRALEIKNKVSGAKSTSAAATMNNLGELLYRLGKTDEAKECLVAAKEIYTDVVGVDHEWTKLVEKNLSEVL
jgi:tetratricopeptide (TPR) repeat protein